MERDTRQSDNGNIRQSDEQYDDDNLTDVSLDEDDEELIGRVFYGDDNNSYGSEEDYSDYEENGSGSSSDEIDGLSDIEDEELVRKYKKLKAGMLDTDLNEEERKRLLIANFTDDQMERFEAYRRMTINKGGVKKIINSIIGHSVPHNISVVLAGISKSFLGDVITKALEIQEKEYKAKLIIDIEDKKNQKREILKSLDRGQEIEVDDRRLQYEGDQIKPLQPHHIREAWRLYKLENSGSISPQWRRQGDADGKMFR
ncbi:histone-fold-containing protein [Scheffersomyces amazonensis]|uniref:histone-fold-containing protein n=1 Tax=Scheffersomyces amazonensis TaxID=1078765 RepID=UPI00315CC962